MKNSKKILFPLTVKGAQRVKGLGDLPKPVRCLLVAMLCLALVSASASANMGTTTLGTRETLSQSNPAIKTNADAEWRDYSRDAEYPKVAALPLEFIDTREGGKLAVIVAVPADERGNPVAEKFPAILTQNAYRIDLGNLFGKLLPGQTTLMIGGQDKFMIRRGYVSVSVDVRGTGMSSGETALLGAEEQAAYADAVNWITQQPWFDGNLGLAGTSYLGIASLLTAAQQNPAVKAAFTVVPMGDAYRGTVAPGGMLNATFINIWLSLTQNLSVMNDPAIKKYPQYAQQIEAATQDHLAASDSFYLPSIYNALDNVSGFATDDGDFWAVRSPIEKAKDIRVPTFVIGASNDIFQRCEPLIYEQLKNNVNAKLMMTKGAHIQAILAALADNTKEGGAPGAENLLLQWFDHYLKGMNTGAESLPNVTQYVEGYGRSGKDGFAIATDWPHPKASPLRFFLHGDMSLDNEPTSQSEGTHDIQEPEAPSVVINTSDDGKRISGKVTVEDASDCSSSAVQWSLGMSGLVPKRCHSNNEKVEKAQDALIFETSRLRSDLYINGPMQADIWMSASNPHAAIAVRIDDVSPTGKVTPISTGLQSAAYRAVDTSRSRYIDGVMVQPWHPFTAASMQPLVPGEPVLVQVEIFQAAALIQRGHRLRIAISSSNQAEGIWPLPLQEAADGNVTTIYNDSDHPSSLVVLTVPESELK